MTRDPSNPFPARVRRCALDVAREGTGALGTLYDLTAQRLLRYAETLTGHRPDAEDALQAAMVQVAVNPRALAGAKNPWAYFLRMVRNESLRILRRRRPQQPLVPPLAAMPLNGGPDDEETRERVRRAVGRLPAAQAEVVVLKVWEEMTFAEIASVLEESPNTVASRYRYALRKLSRALGAFADEVADG